MNGLSPDKVKQMITAGELDTKTINAIQLEYILDLYIKVGELTDTVETIEGYAKKAERNETLLNKLPCVQDPKYLEHREQSKTVGKVAYWVDKLVVPVVTSIVTAIIFMLASLIWLKIQGGI